MFCKSLEEIVIPNTVKVIEEYAFLGCSVLTIATLGDRLEEIGGYAFKSCKSLEEIVIPNAVKAIKKGAFQGCSALTAVTLGEGLEEIGKRAFRRCTSLQRIVIPHKVKTIDDTAFAKCSNLMNVEFCDEIEEFVSCDAMRGWWNQGVHKRSLSTYSFLVKCNIPERLGRLQVRNWQANIFDMLRRIPTIRTKDVDSFFVSIDSRLSFYEILMGYPALLELAIWKSKFPEQFNSSNLLLATQMKMQRRIDSITTINIVVPNVMSFFTDGEVSHCVFDDLRNEDDDNEDDDDKSFASSVDPWFLSHWWDYLYEQDEESHDHDASRDHGEGDEDEG